MQRLVKTLPYYALSNLDYFRKVEIQDKAVYWPDNGSGKKTILPMRLTVDNILFTIREWRKIRDICPEFRISMHS